MSRVVETVTQSFGFPENIEKFMLPSGTQDSTHGNKGFSSIPADILDSPNEFIFYLDVPGLSKSDIQVTVENENILVIRSSGKRKREEVEEEEKCKYIRLERKQPHKLIRKFRLPEDANVSTVRAKCENGFLTVVVEKLPPPTVPKTVEVAVA